MHPLGATRAHEGSVNFNRAKSESTCDFKLQPRLESSKAVRQQIVQAGNPEGPGASLRRNADDEARVTCHERGTDPDGGATA